MRPKKGNPNESVTESAFLLPSFQQSRINRCQAITPGKRKKDERKSAEGKKQCVTLIDELEMVTGGADFVIAEQETVYYDANGNKFTVRVQPQEKPDIIGQQATYNDGSGNAFIVV